MKCCSLDTHRFLLGVSYLLCMIINGFIVIGMETNLSDFAEICGVPLQKASNALIFRSVGSAVGAVLAGPILNCSTGPHFILLLCLLFAGILFELVILTKNITMVFIIFGMMGVLVCIIQTGVLLLIRTSFPEKTGSWLQASQFSFQVAVTVFPLMLDLMTLDHVYNANSMISIAVGVYVISIYGTLNKTNNSQFEDDLKAEDKTDKKVELFAAGDVLVTWTNFFIGGIVVETTTYLTTYVSEAPLTSVIDGNLVLFSLTVSILIGQIVMIPLQYAASTRQIMLYFILTASIAMWSQLAILMYPTSVLVLRIAIVCMGLFMGPMSGLLFDLWDRYTSEPSAYGSSLVNFGCYAGSGFFSVGMYNLWIELENPGILLWANAMGFFLTCVFTFSLRWVTSVKRKLSDDIDLDNEKFIYEDLDRQTLIYEEKKRLLS